MLRRDELCRGSRNAEGGHLPKVLTHRAVPFYGRCCPDRTDVTSQGFPTMPIATDAAFILPDDFAGAALMGRVWRPDLAGPSVVAIRQDGVFDITDEFPTASQLAAAADPAEALRAAQRRAGRDAAGSVEQHAARHPRSDQAMAACPDRSAGDQGCRRHVRRIDAGAGDRGAGARQSGFGGRRSGPR